MAEIGSDLLAEIREKFSHVDHCPIQGNRIFFENAGGALTLKSVVTKSAEFAAIPDNQGRDNPMSQELVGVIEQAKKDMCTFFNGSSGQFFVGESGTELLFRLISTACLGVADGGNVVGSTLEHPATRSACTRWAKITGKDYISVPHNNDTGTVTAEDYLACVNENTRVATILHTSPVTGMAVDVKAVAKVIRSVSPDCYIIVDGIQHAAHGRLDIDSYDVDGYVISPYKVFSRHGYGVAWISDRLTAMPHDSLIDGPENQWELGTRDTGAYATFTEVVKYFEWLGTQVSNENDPRAKIEAAGVAIHAHEKRLTDAMLHGTGNLVGLKELENVQVLGGIDNPNREGLVAIVVKGQNSVDVVSKLRELGIRVHVRKADHYSGNILKPLGLSDCIRVSLCHYNTEHEVAEFLAAIKEIS
ncbi:aminotransferase class V-fold PLP-dependent enzyme [Kiloniella sp.]|uniref:aminotransferase class V-fold PLP-dependent enzyme n=1 Tax=Kiloniella sp. TaxID=1938587 RepID=UPI003B02B823